MADPVTVELASEAKRCAPGNEADVRDTRGLILPAAPQRELGVQITRWRPDARERTTRPGTGSPTGRAGKGTSRDARADASNDLGEMAARQVLPATRLSCAIGCEPLAS
jgi:hypothetical protein